MRATTTSVGTTGSLEGIPRLEGTLDSTGGLVLVYSRLHQRLPSAVPFLAEHTTIGREPENVLPVPESAVSRFHARVERRPVGAVLVDLGSTNGTFVNGVRITEHALREHDLVRVGDSLFRYAARGILGYAAFRIDGTVLEPTRVAKHHLKSPLLGGHQIDLLLDRVDKIAKTPLACVIQGESGTGKELLARTIHTASERRGALQAVNCAALPGSLIESELFGYKRGAFTGAAQDKAGLIKGAHLGTLFLDEIGDMPLEAQAKLLRVLQEREVLPIGATVPEKVDVRVVCATHHDLEALVAEGRFRGDLLARLREMTLRIPPLRHRREDLYLLTTTFLRRAGRADAAVSLPFMLGLAHYDWPYNVRELESAVKLAVALADGAELDARHLPETVQRVLREPRAAVGSPPAASFSPGQPSPAPVAPVAAARASDAGERRAELAERGPSRSAPTEGELREILTRHKGNIAAVGRELGKERMQIHRWLKRYAIDVAEYRDAE